MISKIIGGALITTLIGAGATGYWKHDAKIDTKVDKVVHEKEVMQIAENAAASVQRVQGQIIDIQIRSTVRDLNSIDRKINRNEHTSYDVDRKLELKRELDQLMLDKQSLKTK